MRIAQISPLYESVPPRLYGGTERVVHQLSEELVRLGHDVTLYASADSTTSARLVPVCERSLRLDASCCDSLPWHILEMDLVLRDSRRYDVIHFHTDLVHLPLTRRLGTAHVTTLHGRLDYPDLAPLYRRFSDVPLVSISDAQRRPLPFAGWRRTIHHGLSPSECRFNAGPGRYLAFLGRISPEKKLEDAIAIAVQAGMPLRVAAKLDPKDRAYFESTVRPLMYGSLIEYVGEIGEREKDDFLGNAAALLFPIDWPEPFGLVMIESLARGTPVIARRRGSVPEILEDGVTGFIVEDVAGAVAAVRRLDELDRRQCRAAFERRFSARRMARDYLSVYAGLGAGRPRDASQAM